MLTIRELIKTLYNALLQRMKKYRGNWEQNDPTADDYIKNRPFYTDETDKTIIIPEQQIEVASGRDAAASGGITIIPLSPIIELVVGQSYDIIWNGKNYNCVAYEFEGLRVVGNSSMMSGNDTGEPFFIVISKDMFGGAYIYAYTTGTHMVEVTTVKIVKIDKKYLPDLGLAPVATSGNYNDLSSKPAIYTEVIRYDITQTLTTAQKNLARTNIGAGTGVWDDLKNKPFGIDVTYSDYLAIGSKSSAGIVGSNSFFEINGTYDSILSSDASYASFIIQRHGTQIKKTEYVKGVYNPNCKIYSSTWYFYGNMYLYNTEWENTGEDWCVGVSTSNRVIGFVKGYSTYENTISYSIKTEMLQQLDEKYIPDTIARTSDLHDAPIIDNTLTILGAVAEAKATGDAITQLTEQKADKSDLEKLNTPKDYIILVDQITDFKYRVAIRNGSLVSYIYVEGITVTQMPDKTIYTAGEYLDLTGLVISNLLSDGTTGDELSEYVIDETYLHAYLTEDISEIVVSYVDGEETYTTAVPVTVNPFDPATVLVDFEYIANDDGTYTITDWKGTLNGETSTEMIIPNNGLIIV